MNNTDNNRHAYQDPSLSPRDRALDLLSQMTLQEKLAQLGSIYIFELLEKDDFSKIKALRYLDMGIGHITRLGGASVMDVRQRACIANQIQHFLVNETRLGIPAILHEECCSGFTARGAARFPQMIGLASTWRPELAQEMADTIRQQVRATGSHQGLAPVLDILRDPRWGRSEETFGEDPVLVSRMGVAYVRGLQGEDRLQTVMATGKHFAAHSASEGGMNCTPVHIGMHEFHDVFLLPFEAAIRQAGIMSMMNSYSELDGQVVAASRDIMTTLLRERLGFNGVVVSDYDAVLMLHTHHRMASTLEEAAALALKAGIDVELPRTYCYGEALQVALGKGMVHQDDIDLSVIRLLEKKFELGLFENPFVDEGAVDNFYYRPEHGVLARRIADESLVLLKNEDALLPLSPETGSIAVIGPNAAESRNMLGDYSYASMLEHLLARDPGAKEAYAHIDADSVLDDLNREMPTIVDSIRLQAGESSEIRYAHGCDINSDDRSGFDEAVALARQADVVIMVLGDRSGLTTECTSGEFRDRADLNLPGVQEELLQTVSETGTPLVLVLVNGRPLSLSHAAGCAQAILECWLPGEQGGPAVAAALFGETNPGGKLPVSLPRSVGQLPIFYNHKPSGGHSHIHGDYVSLSSKPLFPFGHGLSYTHFEYSRLEISSDVIRAGEEINISLTVSNVGDRQGSEVVQLYVCDEYASIPRPVKELKGFHRLSLNPGESRQLTFIMPSEMLAFIDADLQTVLEPGKFQVMLGSSSEDIRLEGRFTLKGDKPATGMKRVVHCPVEIH